jgi:hypothetical protein
MFKDRKETNISPEKGQKQAQAHSGPAAVAAQRQLLLPNGKTHPWR